MAPSLLYTYRYANPLRDGSPNTLDQGTLIQAAGMASHRLERSKFREPFQQYRLFDPQLYLSTLDAGECSDTVAKLASYPWFGVTGVPPFDSGEMTQAEWKEEHAPTLIRKWTRRLPSTRSGIARATAECLEFQQRIHCAALISPAPLRLSTSGVGDMETEWWDASIASRTRLAPDMPLLLTLALSDPILRDQEPKENPVLRQLTAELSARRHEIDGVFLVVAQSSVDEYTVSNGYVASSMLQLIGDLSQRANLRVVVGYQGVIGAALLAAGAESWSTGYYRSLRRLRLADYVTRTGRSFPRFASRKLGGDLGVERFIDILWRNRQRDLITETEASKDLLKALRAGKSVYDVVDWQYRSANVKAASSHYHCVVADLAREMSERASGAGATACGRWLAQAARSAEQIRSLPEFDSSMAEAAHQRAWSRAFDGWQATYG